MYVPFCNFHYIGQLTTKHSIFCCFVLCLFIYPLLWIFQWYNCLLTSGVQNIITVIILHRRFSWSTHGFDCCDMDSNGLGWTQIRRKVTMYTKWKTKEKMSIVFVKTLLSPTLSWTVTSRIMKNLITPVDTLFWPSEK